LHRLSSSFGAQLVKQVAGVRLHCVFSYEKFFGDLSIAHALSDELEYLELALGDGKLTQLPCVQREWLRTVDRDFLYDDNFFLPGEFEADCCQLSEGSIDCPDRALTPKVFANCSPGFPILGLAPSKIYLTLKEFAKLRVGPSPTPSAVVMIL